MAYYPIELKLLGVGKETIRGTPVAPSVYIPVTADSEMEYKLNLIEDELIRGIFERFPPQAGTKECSGTIGLEVDDKNCGLFFLSLLGDLSTQDIGGAGGAYQHTFKRHSSEIKLPSLTIYLDRKMVKKRYPLSVVKSVSFTGAGDGKISASFSVIAKTEEDTTEPMTPTWTEYKPFMFHQAKILIDNTQVYNVKDWSLTIDNGATGIRALIGSQDVQDIVAFGKMTVNGTMTIYFENETERNKFLSNTAAQLEIIYEGEPLETNIKRTFKILLPRIHYTAYPFQNVDGLLGASVSFNCYFSLNSQFGVQIILINDVSGY